jgi:hypothetical protein
MLPEDHLNMGGHRLTTEMAMEAAVQDQLLVPVPSTCARLGGVSRTTVYELVKQGQLVKVNIGRRGFITAKSLEAYVNRLSEAASA